MVTTITLWESKKSGPYNSPLPEPALKPPPWIHTITGSGSSFLFSGSYSLNRKLGKY